MRLLWFGDVTFLGPGLLLAFALTLAVLALWRVLLRR